MTSQDRESLLRRALAGEPDASNDLVALLTPVIQARVVRTLFARRGRSPRVEVEDLTQDIFLYFFERDARVLRRWQKERGLSLENFAGLIAERQVLSFLRSGRRNPQQEEAWLEDDDSDPPALDSSPEEVAISREHLSLLFDRLREEVSPLGQHLFDLFYVQELSQAEVMRETGLSADAVYQWRSRLRRWARKALAELSENPVPPRKT